MATNSICKNIDIKSRYQGRRLVSALENAANKRVVDIPQTKMCREIKGEKIKELFDNQ